MGGEGGGGGGGFHGGHRHLPEGGRGGPPPHLRHVPGEPRLPLRVFEGRRGVLQATVTLVTLDNRGWKVDLSILYIAQNKTTKYKVSKKKGGLAY